MPPTVSIFQFPAQESKEIIGDLLEFRPVTLSGH